MGIAWKHEGVHESGNNPYTGSTAPQAVLSVRNEDCRNRNGKENIWYLGEHMKGIPGLRWGIIFLAFVLVVFGTAASALTTPTPVQTVASSSSFSNSQDAAFLVYISGIDYSP